MFLANPSLRVAYPISPSSFVPSGTNTFRSRRRTISSHSRRKSRPAPSDHVTARGRPGRESTGKASARPHSGEDSLAHGGAADRAGEQTGLVQPWWPSRSVNGTNECKSLPSLARPCLAWRLSFSQQTLGCSAVLAAQCGDGIAVAGRVGTGSGEHAGQVFCP